MIIASLAIALASNQPVQEVPVLHYAVTPVATEDRTELKVAMTFQGDPDGTTVIELPRCRYGTPRLWESVTSFIADGADVEHLSVDPRRRALTHEPGAQIAVNYVLSVDPLANQGNAYRPSVGPAHFHFFDSQWRAHIVDRGTEHAISLAFDDVPESWTVFSNLGAGAGPYRAAAEDFHESVFIAGGDYRAARFDLNKKPVGVYIRGIHNPERVAERAEGIVNDLGGRFGAFEGEHYVVSLSSRDGLFAGTAIRDAFVCFADPQSTRLRLDVLIAHEFFHNWLPHTATIEPWKNGSSLDEFRLDWFLEGFTEYVARRVLLEEEWITLDEFVSLFNKDLSEQARNLERDADLAEVEAALAAGGYTNQHERTSYFRGPLIALEWDLQLRKEGRTDLLEVVQEFIERGKKSGGTVEESVFFAMLEEHGLPAQALYEQHIVNGEPPSLRPDVFGPDFIAEPLTIVPKDPGFNTVLSRRKDRIHGVRVGGPAHTAGLRDGMELTSYKRARKKDDPVVVTVLVDGAERSFEYLPKGTPVETIRFVRTED